MSDDYGTKDRLGASMTCPPVPPHSTSNVAVRPGFWLLALAAMVLAACVNPPPRPPPVDPDAVRAEIVRLMPAKAETAQGWAIDIFAAFEALKIPPTSEHICGVLAVTEQESNFQVDPLVPDLPAIARREIEARAASHHIPKFMVGAALEIHSPNGLSFRERLEHARTEKDLSELFEDFIGSVPLGERLFGDWNPVRTGGPMQVSIEFAEKQAKEKHYPYPVEGNIRSEVFTRRGGLFFGVAHLLAYTAPYDDMVFRFADYNAGHYASRNAAFQNAVNIVSKKRLALDGDLLIEGADKPSNTELAIRTIGEPRPDRCADPHCTGARRGARIRADSAVLASTCPRGRGSAWPAGAARYRAAHSAGEPEDHA